MLDPEEVMEEVMGGRQLLTSFWTFTRFRRKVAGNKSTGLFPALILGELVFLCHE
jgi:hypothetical protein